MFLCGGDGCVRIWNIIPFHQQAEDQPVQKIGECVYNHDACGQGILDDRAVTSDHTKDVRKITAEENQHDIGKTTKRGVFNRKFISKNDVAKTYHQLSCDRIDQEADGNKLRSLFPAFDNGFHEDAKRSGSGTGKDHEECHSQDDSQIKFRLCFIHDDPPISCAPLFLPASEAAFAVLRQRFVYPLVRCRRKAHPRMPYSDPCGQLPSFVLSLL